MPGVLDRRELTITRLFDAPRRLVFACWTEPERLAIWWGPTGFAAPVRRVDARAGGEIYIVMRAPDGQEFPMSGSFRDVVPPERLVFISRALGPGGEILLEGLTTVTFEDLAGKTRMTLHSEATALEPIAVGMLQGMEAGWTQSIEKLLVMVASSKN